MDSEINDVAKLKQIINAQVTQLEEATRFIEEQSELLRRADRVIALQQEQIELRKEKIAFLEKELKELLAEDLAKTVYDHLTKNYVPFSKQVVAL